MNNFMRVICILFVSLSCVYLYPLKNDTLCEGDCSHIRLHDDSYSSASINTNTSSIIRNAVSYFLANVKENTPIACSKNQRKDPRGKCRDIDIQSGTVD